MPLLYVADKTSFTAAAKPKLLDIICAATKRLHTIVQKEAGAARFNTSWLFLVRLPHSSKPVTASSPEHVDEPDTSHSHSSFCSGSEVPINVHAQGNVERILAYLTNRLHN